MVYDNPVDILNNRKTCIFQRACRPKHKILFAQSVDISALNDTNIIEQVLKEPRYSPLGNE